MVVRTFPDLVGRPYAGGTSINNSHGASWVRGRLLGQGGFGSVFLGKSRKPNEDHNQLPALMAVKSADMDQAHTLKHEKQVLSTLKNSPFVVKCYGDEVTESGDGKVIYNILLEYCSGCSLSDHIKESKTGLPESEIKCYTRDILRGLQFVHGHWLVHCDIKPSNILLASNSSSRSGLVAKISDFGLCKYENEEAVETRGTRRYMAPEVIEDNILERPADIWAVGCVVLEMMSGKVVWGVSTVDDDLLMRIAYSPELPEFPSNVSETGRDFLEKCLVKCADYRWSAEALLGHPFLLQPSS
ncbi:Pkinase domain-containing protein [Cephalotus follicularis]|uniref:Pkinase domain-containing protein n=1 Tax=Cephalotus follicularis TaxID=3775 RepID=A0A1Q3D664_CEPFO|nr:Pkinase domain-containing protein [Cephalotus follicularis]